MVYIRNIILGNWDDGSSVLKMNFRYDDSIDRLRFGFDLNGDKVDILHFEIPNNMIFTPGIGSNTMQYIVRAYIAYCFDLHKTMTPTQLELYVDEVIRNGGSVAEAYAWIRGSGYVFESGHIVGEPSFQSIPDYILAFLFRLPGKGSNFVDSDSGDIYEFGVI